MAKKDAISVIDANIEKIASIEGKRKLQNINLKDEALSKTESNIDNIESDNNQLEKTIKENGGLLNSMRRLLGEMKEFWFRSAKQTEAQNNSSLSGNSVKSVNNQLVKISMLSRDKDLESAEKFGGSVLNKVGYEKQDIIAVENEDNTGKVSR